MFSLSKVNNNLFFNLFYVLIKYIKIIIKNKKMTDTIQQFVAGVIERAGINNMPDDFKKEYVEKLSIEAQKRIGMMALEELDEKGVKTFEQFVGDNKSPKPEEVLDFFNNHIPDFTEKVKNTLQVFADEFVKGAEKLKGTKL